MKRHPHEGRIAETYRRNPDWPQPGKGPAHIWVGYASDPPAGASWSVELAAWILNEEAKI